MASVVIETHRSYGSSYGGSSHGGFQRELGLDVFPGAEITVPTRVTKVGEVVST